MKPALTAEAKARKQQGRPSKDHRVELPYDKKHRDSSNGKAAEAAAKILGIGASTLTRGERIAREHPEKFAAVEFPTRVRSNALAQRPSA